MSKIEILLFDRLPAPSRQHLEERFIVHEIGAATGDADRPANGIRAIARGGHSHIDRPLIERLPKLEIIANFGVGYDGIDLKAAGERGVVVTNTPDVLTEEVADTAIGLLTMTVRELSAAERHLRAGRWPKGTYPLTAGSLRDRTFGLVGFGRIGTAIARRLAAAGLPVVYHARHQRTDAPYRHYAELGAMAEAVDTLIVVLPGNASTRDLIDATILRALGPRGILINIGRGVVVNEPALIEALRNKTIMAAGLDVFADEPNVPPELIAMENVVLLPHVGSASVHTRNAMGKLVVDNLLSWFEAGKPLTPVPETPWPRPEA